MTVNDSYSEAQLLILIARGDEYAFARFYRRTSAGIYNAVMGYVKDDNAAREIVQVVFVKLWDKRHLLREVESADDYLFVLTRNTVFDHFKEVTVQNKRLAGLRRRVPVLHNNVMTRMQEQECGNLLKQVVGRLPSQQRQAYLLLNEQEMSYGEIADHMQVSRLTVKRHLELARRFVRKYLYHHLTSR